MSSSPSLRASTLYHLDELLARHPTLSSSRPALLSAAELLCRCQRDGGKLLVCGNGGSAADSEHIVGELMKNFALARRVPLDDAQKLQTSCPEDAEYLTQHLQPGLASIALTANSSLASAICNDTDACFLFAQQVYVYGRPGDVLMVLSTSGNSRNVLAAVKVARAFGLSTVGLGGHPVAAMDEWCDILIKIPDTSTAVIQELHRPVYHALCLMVEEELFGADA